jgi:hypothetical protein
VGRTAALRPPLGGGRIRRRKLGGWWIRHRNHRDGPLDEGNIGKGAFYISMCVLHYVILLILIIPLKFCFSRLIL